MIFKLIIMVMAGTPKNEAEFREFVLDVVKTLVALIEEKDPTISLRLISVANSPVYRGITGIRNVKTAIPRLGLKETLNIVLAIANKSLYETKKGGGIGDEVKSIISDVAHLF